MNEKIRTLTDLFEFVQHKEALIDWSKMTNVNETTVACGDPVLDHYAEWLLVGGVANIYLSGRLAEYISLREGKKGILEGHLGCGWMFTRGYRTYDAQRDLISTVRYEVQKLNKEFNSGFVVPKPNHLGSAAPFMIGRP